MSAQVLIFGSSHRLESKPAKDSTSECPTTIRAGAGFSTPQTSERRGLR